LNLNKSWKKKKVKDFYLILTYINIKQKLFSSHPYPRGKTNTALWPEMFHPNGKAAYCHMEWN